MILVKFLIIYAFIGMVYGIRMCYKHENLVEDLGPYLTVGLCMLAWPRFIIAYFQGFIEGLKDRIKQKREAP